MHQQTVLTTRSGCGVCLINESIRLAPRLTVAKRSNVGLVLGVASLAILTITTTAILIL
jgi:hypothetical protein